MSSIHTVTNGMANRITVNLSDAASEAMERSTARGRRGKTEVVNVAVIRNDFFEDVIASGKSILLENQDGELERVHLL
jgi:hypothetical protein